MVKTWKVSWNKKLYDYKSIIESFKRGEEDIIYQSKGRARMKNEPKEGDNVYVSCNKLKIMKCMVISNFRIGHEETLDIYNRGNPRNHTNNNTYLKMKILETFDEPIILKGCQRTWSKYTAVKISNGVKQSMLSHHEHSCIRPSIFEGMEIDGFNPTDEFLGNMNCLISPISTTNKKAKGHIDYMEQIERIGMGKTMFWDDAKGNTAIKGDLFGFYHYKDVIEIYEIEEVYSPEHRLPSWSDNVGQTDRNVIALSEKICQIPWDVWIELGGRSRCQGTSWTRSSLSSILDWIQLNTYK